MGLKKIRGLWRLGVILLMTASCMPGIYDDLARTTEDPFEEVPKAESFLESYAVYLKWGKDEGADEYILERAPDRLEPEFREIYRGAGTEYRDRDLEEGMYLYRLSKKRGEKTFGPWEAALGVSLLDTQDEYEPNNEERKGKLLEAHPYMANLYYFQGYYKSLKIQDEDWYYFDIPAQWRANIIIHDLKAPSLMETHFKIYIKDRTGEKVTQDHAITISNYENKTYRCYFKIYPDETVYIDSSTPYGVGGDMAGYTVRIAQLMPGAE